MKLSTIKAIAATIAFISAFTIIAYGVEAAVTAGYSHYVFLLLLLWFIFLFFKFFKWVFQENQEP